MKPTHVFVRDFPVWDSRGKRVYSAGTQVQCTAQDWFQCGVEQGAIVPIGAAQPPEAETHGEDPGAVPHRRDGESDVQFAERLAAHMRQVAESGTLPRRRDGESDVQFAERLAAHMREGIGTQAGDLGDQIVALLRQRPAGTELVRP